MKSRECQRYRKMGFTLLRRGSGLVEAVCKHGVGHPVPESVREMTKAQPNGMWNTHGCDGCCRAYKEVGK